MQCKRCITIDILLCSLCFIAFGDLSIVYANQGIKIPSSSTQEIRSKLVSFVSNHELRNGRKWLREIDAKKGMEMKGSRNNGANPNVRDQSDNLKGKEGHFKLLGNYLDSLKKQGSSSSQEMHQKDFEVNSRVRFHELKPKKQQQDTSTKMFNMFEVDYAHMARRRSPINNSVPVNKNNEKP